ncbi:ribosomal protein S18-alanine N-acetyltransferase [Shewanella intestini]|uniref:[Ribosomal protein bS18]-alanine N-acetyltransferase n=1 Tax=Shewanella intestini TaxID=2017544 RepID=A0ABS5I145_9GAMM|nr:MULTISPECIES: ribosomal protein S18-alanine N-acetyltransferase [Shewanella]MBR9727742.1 ribosomal protein S18-alanine N-acetyltransferase [Shewanella intestini]MRG35108.1 ribosomal-protein-alanine N-acetyltransferase [Shewanella sp. XMDDZSB0408]
MLNITIDTLTQADVAQMARVESAAHLHPWSQASLADCFGRLYRVIGAWDQQGSALLGFAIVQQILDEVTLMDICVQPQSQGLGIGKLLLTNVIEQAKAHNGALIMLEVRESNLGAIGLYTAQGFKQTGLRKDYYPTADGHEPALLMDYML